MPEMQVFFKPLQGKAYLLKDKASSTPLLFVNKALPKSELQKVMNWAKQGESEVKSNEN